jgi:hypothetical protein
MRPVPQDDIAECDHKLARYRAALDAGADPGVVAGWISDVENARRVATERAAAEATEVQPLITREVIEDLLDRLGDIADVLAVAEPADKAELYQALKLELAYDPERRRVRVCTRLRGEACAKSSCRRGDLNTARM